MKIHPECIPCAYNQILKIGRLIGAKEDVVLEIMRDFSRILPRLDYNKPPVIMAREIKKIVRARTGVEDPFREMKRKHNLLALSQIDRLRKVVERSSDRLLTAIRVAIAGNIMDATVTSSKSLEEVLEESLIREFAIFDYESFKEDLERTEEVLYIADNAGEIVFDRILIEEIGRRGKRVIVAVRGEPILNDATIEDAREALIDEVAQIVDTGSPFPGTFLDSVSAEFLELYRKSKLKIAKGQGNFETLSSEDSSLYFLLMVKCQVIAKELGVKTGSLIIMKSRGRA